MPANRVGTSGCEGGECSRQCTSEERCSMREEIPTGAVVRHRRTSTQAKWEKGQETK